MDDILRNLLLVLCGLAALVALLVTYLWYFVFGRSLRAVVMAGLSIMMNRDSTIDLDADVVLERRPEQVKKEMTQEVESLDFHGNVTAHDKYVPQITDDESDNFGAQTAESQPPSNNFVSSSFEGGRFRRVTQAFTRPFLRMRINAQGRVGAQNVKQKPDPSDIE